jgi:hypothetical protein
MTSTESPHPEVPKAEQLPWLERVRDFGADSFRIFCQAHLPPQYQSEIITHAEVVQGIAELNRYANEHQAD